MEMGGLWKIVVKDTTIKHQEEQTRLLAVDMIRFLLDETTQGNLGNPICYQLSHYHVDLVYHDYLFYCYFSAITCFIAFYSSNISNDMHFNNNWSLSLRRASLSGVDVENCITKQLIFSCKEISENPNVESSNFAARCLYILTLFDEG